MIKRARKYYSPKFIAIINIQTLYHNHSKCIRVVDGNVEQIVANICSLYDHGPGLRLCLVPVVTPQSAERIEESIPSGTR